jgi:hypothetical protein
MRSRRVNRFRRGRAGIERGTERKCGTPPASLVPRAADPRARHARRGIRALTLTAQTRARSLSRHASH